MAWPRFKVFWFSIDNPTWHSEGKKEKRQTEEEVGRQYQRVGRNGLCQLKQDKMEIDYCEFICGAPDDLPGVRE